MSRIDMRGRAILTTCIMLVSGPAFGQSLHHGWSVDARTGCRVWSADPQPDGSIRWSGDCQSGTASEPGILQWIRDGKPDNQGKPSGALTR
jgi:hypothetical protein